MIFLLKYERFTWRGIFVDRRQKRHILHDDLLDSEKLAPEDARLDSKGSSELHLFKA